MTQLLAVDLGLRTGLALYSHDGKCLWYRSHHFGKPAQLKRRVYSLLDLLPDVEEVVIEGGGSIGEIWTRETARRGLSMTSISAEDWRPTFFYPREVRSTLLAKRHAGQLARRVIEWSGADRPTSLRHDAAEAILIGLWGVLQKGWLDRLPDLMNGGFK